MGRTWILAALGCVLSCPCVAQTLAGNEAAAQMVSAAGMPLQVGDLSPGTLTVRVVRGAFVENINRLVVRVEIGGVPAQEAATDAQGRATFQVPPGAEVRATATVDGEVLESQRFPMPLTGGVRLLLVAGGDEPAAPAGIGVTISGSALPAGHPVIAAPAVPSTMSATDDDPDGRIAATGILAGLTITTALVFTRRTWRRH